MYYNDLKTQTRMKENGCLRPKYQLCSVIRKLNYIREPFFFIKWAPPAINCPCVWYDSNRLPGKQTKRGKMAAFNQNVNFSRN